MDVDPAIYNKINKLQIESARDLITLILAGHPQRNFDVILDVGCGTGNVTKILSDSIPHKNIIAFDMDSTMISQADLNNTNKATDFITEDISKPWDNLGNKLKALEGRVDLIFSNFVLHWISIDARNVVLDNLFRLLKPDGLMYSIIPIVDPIGDLVRSESKANIEKYIKIDSSEAQISNWINYFELNGFQNVEAKLNKYEWNFNTTEEFRNMLPIFRNFYFKLIFTDQMDDQTREDLISKVEEISVAFSIKSKTPSLDNLESEKYTVPIAALMINAKAIKIINN